MTEANIIPIEEVVSEENVEIVRQQKKDFYTEKILILILGILIGVAVKTEAIKRITIGFDDYLMKFENRGYDLNKMQDEQIQKMMAEQKDQEGEMKNKVSE